MLNVQEFIRANSDWECLLSSEPYCMSISRDDIFGRQLVMFKYDQTRSDLSIPLVQECRGLILDAVSLEVVSHPFHKFFNYGEELAADIDWKTAWTSSKIDGSIIKVVNLDGDNFLISTNGMIDAFKCSVSDSVGCPYASFGELFMEGMKFYGLTMEDFPRLFKPGFTYMFELTSPWNQVVVQWKKTKVWFIGVRDNSTGKETRFSDHELSKIFDTPTVFSMRSFDDVVKAAKELPDDEEGYVVCDSGFRRVKVKSPRYVQLHYMAGNQTWSASRVIDIIRDNEVSEYVAYFPKFKAAFDVVKGKYDAYVGELEDVKEAIDDLMEVEWDNITKKNFAKWVFTINTIRPYSGFAFAYFDSVYAKTKKDDAVVKSVEEYLAKMPTAKLVEALGL